MKNNSDGLLMRFATNAGLMFARPIRWLRKKNRQSLVRKMKQYSAFEGMSNAKLERHIYGDNIVYEKTD